MQRREQQAGAATAARLMEAQVKQARFRAAELRFRRAEVDMRKAKAALPEAVEPLPKRARSVKLSQHTYTGTLHTHCQIQIQRMHCQIHRYRL